MDRLEVLLARRHERAGQQLREALDDAAHHLAHTVLDEARVAMGLLDHRALVRALHQLVDLRAHRALDDLQQVLGLDDLDALLGAADMQRAEAALVVRGDGDVFEDALDLVVVEAVVGQALAGGAGDELLRTGARGHALRRDADDAARAALAGHRAAEQGVELLRLDARQGGGLVLGEARLDRDLGAPRVLTLANEFGDVLGELLGAEGRLAEDDLADGVVDHLLEARHVRSLLLRAEVDKAVQARVEELLTGVAAQADDLLHAGDTHARERDMDGRALRLDVGHRGSKFHGHEDRPLPCLPNVWYHLPQSRLKCPLRLSPLTVDTASNASEACTCPERWSSCEERGS